MANPSNPAGQEDLDRSESTDALSPAADHQGEQLAAALLARAQRIVVLSGAGLSTGSGIPDFRGPNGLWTRDPGKAKLFDFDSYVADAALRRQAWRSRAEHPAWRAQPNDGHRALVQWAQAGVLTAVLTQNIDGLHVQAGLPGDLVVELHGTLREVVCLGCGDITDMTIALDRVRNGEADPACQRCGGILKSNTISFGQQLDPTVVAAAVAAARSADVFVVLGSSLTVQPAAGLCDVAVASGAALVVANAEPTPYDGIAATTVRSDLSHWLPRVRVATASP